MRKSLKSSRDWPILLAMLLFGTHWPISSTAANKNVWIDYPVTTRSAVQDWRTCLGTTEWFEANQDGHPPGNTWFWSGATRYTEPTVTPSWAYNSWNTAGGPRYVTASYAGEQAHSVRVTVYEVDEITVSGAEATPIDDGDGDPDTQTVVVCPCMGQLTITATPNPAVQSEEDLPGCWTFGGTGGWPVGWWGLLQWTLLKIPGTSTTFVATAGTSSKSLTVIIPSVTSVDAYWEDIYGNRDHDTTFPNNCSFFGGLVPFEQFFVTTAPDVPGLPLKLEKTAASPSTSDQGTILDEYFFYSTLDNRYEGADYVAKTEGTGNICATDPYLQDQQVSFAVTCPEHGTVHATIDVTVVSGFNWLLQYKYDHEKAIDFVTDKYACVDETYATFDPSLADYGQTSIYGSVTVGPAAFDSENLLASTLVHERVHQLQGYLVRLAAQAAWLKYIIGIRDFQVCPWPNIELEAYDAELQNLSSTCLSSNDQNLLSGGIQYYLDVKQQCGCN